MGNLGRYQDIVTDAKLAGGVDNLIAAIESKAVAVAAPRILALGAGGGVVVVLAAQWSALRYKGWKSDRVARAEAAKAQLKDVVENALDTDIDQSVTANDEVGHKEDDL
jgi:hypothetical protein